MNESNPIRLKDIIDFSDISSSDFDKVLDYVANLEQELKNLISSMATAPIEQLVIEQKNLTKSYSEINAQAIKTNQTTKEGAQALSLFMSIIQDTRKEVDLLIDSKRGLTKSEEELKGALRGANQMIRDSAAEMEKLKVKGLEGTSMFSTYQQRIVEATLRLEELNSESKKNSDVIQKNIGYYQSLKNLLVILKDQFDGLSSEEAKSADIGGKLNKQIADLNLLLKSNQKEQSGVLETQSVFNNIKEKTIQITNKLNAVLSDENKELIENQILLKNINKELALEADPEKRIALMQKSQALRLKQLEKEQNDIEKFKQKEIEGDDKVAQNALNNDLKKVEADEAALSKMLQDHEKYQIKIEEEEDALRMKVLENDLKKVEADQEAARRSAEAAEKAEMRKQQAAEKTTILYKLQQFVVRDLFRLVAAMITIYPIMALIDFLVTATKNIFGFGEAATKATENIKEFGLSIKNAVEDVNKDFDIEMEKIKILIQSGNDLSLSYEKRTDAINKLRDAYGGLLDKYSDMEIFESKEAKERMDKSNTLKRERDEAQKIYEQSIENISRYRKENNDFENDIKYRHSLSPLDPRAMFAGGAVRDDRIGISRNQELINRETGTLSTRQTAFENADKKYRDFQNSNIDGDNLNRLEKEKANKELERNRLILPKEMKDARDKGASINQYEAILKSHPEYDNKVVQLQKEIDELDKEIKAIKGKHDPKGRTKKDKNLQDRLFDENESNSQINKTYKSELDASPQSLEDKKIYYTRIDNQAEDHLKNQLKIIERYGKASGDSEEKLDGLRKKAFAEFLDIQNKTEEERNRDIINLKKYNDEQLKLIEDINQKLEKRTEQQQRHNEQMSEQDLSGKINLRKAKRFNLISALFGGSGKSSIKDFKDDIALRDAEIGSDKNLLGKDKENLNVKNWDIMLKKQEIVEDDKIPSNLKTESQKLDAKSHLEQLSKFESEKTDLISKSSQDELKLKKDVEDKDKTLEERKRDNKIKVAQEAFNATEKIANSAFDLQKKRIQTQMNNVQSLANFEMTIAGNNSAAKIRIAQKEHVDMLRLKREQARVEKNQAVFSATIDMAKGIAAATAVDPPFGFILAGLVAAAELKSISDITSEPLPSYAKGRKGGKKEIARINEQGTELVESNGLFKIFGGGKETLANLDQGDIVHTHKESMDMIESDKFIKNVLDGTGAFITNEKNSKKEMYSIMAQSIVSKKDFKDAMSEALKETKENVIINLPAQDVQDKYNKQLRRNGL